MAISIEKWIAKNLPITWVYSSVSAADGLGTSGWRTEANSPKLLLAASAGFGQVSSGSERFAKRLYKIHPFD